MRLTNGTDCWSDQSYDRKLWSVAHAQLYNKWNLLRTSKLWGLQYFVTNANEKRINEGVLFQRNEFDGMWSEWRVMTYDILASISDIWTWRVPWCVCLNSAIFPNTFHYGIVTHFCIFRQTNCHIPWIILWCGFHFEFVAFTANKYGRYRLTRFRIDTSVGESKACFCLATILIEWIFQSFLRNGLDNNKRLMFHRTTGAEC